MGLSKSNFRTLLGTMWLLAVAAYAVRPLDWNSMPAGMRDAVSAAYPTALPVSVEFYYLLSYLYLFLFLASTVGLFAFKDWARRLFLIYYVAGFALGLVPTFTSFGRPYYFVGGLFSFTSALTLSLIFFSPLKDRFNGDRAEEFR
jgi:hypothetical protein